MDKNLYISLVDVKSLSVANKLKKKKNDLKRKKKEWKDNIFLHEKKNFDVAYPSLV